MRRWLMLPPLAAALTACVTINVYFPAAEAREAAKQFVEKVINDPNANTVEPVKPGGGSASIQAPWTERAMAGLARVDFASLVGIGSAYAQGQPNFKIQTPAIQAIQARMEQRFDAQLREAFDAGALGFTADGLVTVRDASKLALKDRVAVNQAVADENRDRAAVYREIAVANGHPEWESRIREEFARQWIASAHAGWWYQSGGGWKQKYRVFREAPRGAEPTVRFGGPSPFPAPVQGRGAVSGTMRARCFRRSPWPASISRRSLPTSPTSPTTAAASPGCPTARPCSSRARCPARR